MKISLLLFLFFQTTSLFAFTIPPQEQIKIDQKMAQVFSTFESSNNIKVIVGRLREHMSPQLFFAITKELETLKHTHLVFKRISAKSFKIQVTENQWITFVLNSANRTMLVNSTPFSLDRKKSPSTNIEELKKIIKHLIQPNKTVRLDTLFFPEAKAFLPAAVWLIIAVAGTAAGTAYYIHDEITFGAGVATGLSACRSKNWDIADTVYKEARDVVEPFVLDYVALDKFHELQNCMLKAGRIKYEDAYEPRIERNEVPGAFN